MATKKHLKTIPSKINTRRAPIAAKRTVRLADASDEQRPKHNERTRDPRVVEISATLDEVLAAQREPHISELGRGNALMEALPGLDLTGWSDDAVRTVVVAILMNAPESTVLVWQRAMRQWRLCCVEMEIHDRFPEVMRELDDGEASS